MHPVLIGLEQIKTRNLQRIVNIRNYKNLSWDSLVRVDFKLILQLAYQEIEYWIRNIGAKNVRRFKVPVSNVVAWTDASDVAIGGLAVQLQGHVNAPIAADNWLLDSTLAYKKLLGCASMQTALQNIFNNSKVIIRDKFDLDPFVVTKLVTVQKNLRIDERVTDSNERKLMAAVHLIDNCAEMFANCSLTVHFDNMNAAAICTKGSSKIRLQKYAETVLNLCEKSNISLKAVWIPRDLNHVADMISKEIDFDDYQIMQQFFDQICNEFKVYPTIDCFANADNSKTKNYFSLYFEKGCSGINCFNYDWKLFGTCWWFPPPKLVGKTVEHAKKCSGEGLLLIPQWKNSHFYAVCQNIDRKYVRKVIIFDGKNGFQHGFDKNSYFGPEYKGNVVIYWLKFF
jgi:hypothetical protein